MVPYLAARRHVAGRGGLALLVCAVVAALLIAWGPVGLVGATASAIAPSIALDPERGPCETRPVMRGRGFPANARIAIFSERTNPPGEKVGSQIAEATAGADGTFMATLLVINGDCIDLDNRTPEGTLYTMTAAVAATDGGPSASTTFTIDRSVPPNFRCFQETNHCVQGRFLDYWRAHGLDLGDQGVSEREALALFGYPLSDEFEQRLEDGRTYTVQYFERVRMEYHPENAAPYDVLLGQFGRHILAAVPGAPTARVQAVPGIDHFPETGHNVGPPFSTFWARNGGLAVFGYPLSEPFTQTLEDGREYTVQYFERARFEEHPAQEGMPYNIQLGQFGRRILTETAGR